MTCRATPDVHCCWVGGKVCPFFDVAGLADDRDGACMLRTELGSWAKVHTDPRYLGDVKAKVPSFVENETWNCGSYPQKKCYECGVTNG